MGKTKDIVQRISLETYPAQEQLVFRFKDEGCQEGGVFNPGANEAGLQMNGMARASLLLSNHFFSLLDTYQNIRTHFIGINKDTNEMTVNEVKILPIEFIWRDKAWGSFCKRYGVEQGKPLEGLIESTLKNDELGDPLINADAIIALELMQPEEYQQCITYTDRICEIIKEELASYDYELIDIKLEFGIQTYNGELVLADEISGGIWRILDKDGNVVDPIVAAKKICADEY